MSIESANYYINLFSIFNLTIIFNNSPVISFTIGFKFLASLATSKASLVLFLKSTTVTIPLSDNSLPILSTNSLLES